MARNLTDTTIVIIGATGVLGSCIAQQLADAGVHVAAVVRDSASLDPAVVSTHAVADITDHAALRSAFASLGPIDGVINAAGGARAPCEDTTRGHHQIKTPSASAPDAVPLSCLHSQRPCGRIDAIEGRITASLDRLGDWDKCGGRFTAVHSFVGAT